MQSGGWVMRVLMSEIVSRWMSKKLIHLSYSDRALDLCRIVSGSSIEGTSDSN